MTEATARTNKIAHEGTVREVFGNSVDVAIVSEAACGSCKLKKACGMDESREKMITVFTPDASLFRVGQRVEVVMKQALGYWAMAVAYVVPVFVVLAALAVLVRIGVPELISGVAALVFLAIYYFLLYLFRDRIGKTIRFEIRIPKNAQPE
jgi:sigma-E factor negative regulatory protein RseC